MLKKLNLLLGSVFCITTGGVITTISTSCGPETNPYAKLSAGTYYSINNVKEANYMIQYVTSNKCDIYSESTYQYISDANLNTTALGLTSDTTVSQDGETILYWELAYYLAVNIKTGKISNISFANIEGEAIIKCDVNLSDMTINFHFYNGGTNQVDGVFSYKNVDGHATSHITSTQITSTQDTNTLYWNTTQLIN